MLNLEINGRRISARRGNMLLDAIREAGVAVPTLCHHEALEPYGACRLCVVEIRRPGVAAGRIVASCAHPVEAGLVVETDTDAVHDTRREVLDLLLARAPGAVRIRELAESYGLRRSTYPPDQGRDNCVLCGLCTRMCAKLGFSAITMAGRGPDREVVPPLNEPPPDCVGCGSCARVCPTDNIPLVDRAGMRRIWDRDFEMVACKQCGRAYLTREYMQRRVEASDLPETHFELCDECSRARLARTMFAHMFQVAGDRAEAEKGAAP